MVQGVVKGTEEQGFISGDVDETLLRALAEDMAPLGTSVDSRAGVLLELAGIKAAIQTWHRKDPSLVLREASAYTARLTTMWTELRELEGRDREWTQLRTMQVQPVLDEVERQYKFIQSRIALMRQEIDMLGGAGT